METIYGRLTSTIVGGDRPMTSGWAPTSPIVHTQNVPKRFLYSSSDTYFEQNVHHLATITWPYLLHFTLWNPSVSYGTPATK